MFVTWQEQKTPISLPSFRATANDSTLAEFREALGALRTPEALTLICMDVQLQILFSHLRSEGRLKSGTDNGLSKIWPDLFVALRDGTLTPEDYFLKAGDPSPDAKQSTYFFLTQATMNTQLLRAWSAELPTDTKQAEELLFSRAFKSAVKNIGAYFESPDAAKAWAETKLIKDWREFRTSKEGQS